ncbi:hypothetical protein QMK19_16910 [Streptomyces sp. H10-C2]|uniref:hypothetical protein n=1 Tax=unclassified Streptomyces TaxID=2593676 RepID=UPI0024BA9377|nr:MULTISPECIES: hypothetical protein [unclassified Streptomyces]MDJ0341581.1 hypothetical protein [Streptomyces sp. PH10-H1]MDJ0371317.1 hypothetical protein [Streptomyces sp. H10-C2]
MSLGFAPETTTRASSRLSRSLEPAEWTAAGIPLLANPRDVVKDLHSRHLPAPTTAVVAVFDPQGRLTASASFTGRAGVVDGWEHRNAILANLRRVLPHDLRRRTPVRTAVLLVCRDGAPGWTERDGAWMWGLRDACTLHGLRCGAYVTLTQDGWHVLGENRAGRTPNSTPWSQRPGGAAALRPRGAPEALRRTTAR